MRVILSVLTAGPLFGLLAAGCGAPPQWHPPPPMSSQNGPILKTPRIVSLEEEGDPLASQLNAFCTGLGKTIWWSNLATPYGLGSPLPCMQAFGPAITADIADPDIQTYVIKAATAAGIPLDGNNLFLLYLPSGISATNGTTVNTNCSTFLGYHGVLPGGSDTYAVMQRCASDSATISETAGEMLSTASHEIAEAVTDSRPPFGYVFRNDTSSQTTRPLVWSVLGQGGEVGDLCEGTGGWAENGFNFERYWSNANATAGEDPCAPVPEGPYLTAFTEHDWYSVGAGGSLAIPLEAHASGVSDDWVIFSTTSFRSAAGFASSVDSSLHEPFEGTTYAEMNVGKQAQLNVLAPQAPAGSFAVFRIWSKTKSAMSAPLNSSSYHLTYWPVGVYIH